MDFAAAPGREEELTLHEIGRLARSLGKGLYNVNLTGGEPFIRSDMYEIIECYAHTTSVRSIVITTNGWFTDAIMRSAERYLSCLSPCRITFSISLDDIGKEHDIGRNLGGLYDKAFESYRMLKAWHDPRISVSIALTVTAANASRIETIYSGLRAAGVVKVFPVLFREEGVQHSMRDRESLCRAYGRLAHLIENSRTPGVPGNRVVDATHRAKNRIVHQILGDPDSAGRFHASCTAGSLFGTIMADGTVAPCELLASRYPLGNLRDHDMNFARIWNGCQSAQVRDAVRGDRCHCTFECVWTVNVLARPAFWPRLALTTLRELL
jgi:MoaA/NifB/PqqE/SkfB family radical SAM enzyme